MKQYSLFWIKPDVFYDKNHKREAGSELKNPLPEPELFIEEVKKSLVSAGFEILDERKYSPDREIAWAHYKEHFWVFTEWYTESKYDFLVNFMTSGPSYWIVFYWDDAVLRGREILKTIREKYLLTPKLARCNMTHASDNEAWAREEIQLHFPNFTFTK